MILSIEHLTKSYKDNIVLDDISFSISEPSIIGLVAPNGSGKTTLFDVITNIQKADNGIIQAFGVSNTLEMFFRKMSYMQDNKVLYPELSALDHLTYVAGCHRLKQEVVTNLVDKLHMSHYLKMKTKNYSLGMKQTLLLGMAVINQPKLLLLDEPINGLDVTACNVFRDIINELHEAGSTIIISSHNLEEIEKLTSKVLFLKDGVLLSGDDEEIIQKIEETPAEYVVILDSTEKLAPSIQQFSFKIISDFKILITLNKSTLMEFESISKENQCQIYEIRPTKNLIHQIYELLY